MAVTFDDVKADAHSGLTAEFVDECAGAQRNLL
jgi:hypothetical protein